MALAKMRIRVIEFPFKPVVKASPTINRKVNVEWASEMELEIKAVLDIPHPPASVPGEPPRRRSRTLQSGITVRAEGNTIKIRTPQYGIWLEGGFGNLKGPRPFIRSTIHAQRRKWARRRNTLARAELAKVAKKKRRR